VGSVQRIFIARVRLIHRFKVIRGH